MPSLSPLELQKRLGTIQGELKAHGKPNTLSVCMIVKNEDATIERAIRSFLPFADEIIVNDTGSTDRTVEILKTLPKVKVIHSEWKRDFSYSRNLSLDAATCTWCLWMDADDVVPPEQAVNFSKLKHAPLDRAFGFQIINTQGGGQPVGAHFMQVRMFPNHPQIRFERRIHEQIVYSVGSLGLYMIYTEATIYHMGYETDEMRISKSKRNLELILTEPDRGIDPVISTQLGDAYMILGKPDDAISAFQEVLTIPGAEVVNPDAFEEVYINIGKCYQTKGDYNEAVRWHLQAEERTPNRIDPFFYNGESMFRLQRYTEARTRFIKVLGMKRTHSSQASHWDVMRMYSYKYLCDIAILDKDYQALLDWASKFSEEYPQVVEGPILKGKALLNLGDAKGAIPLFEKGIAANPTANRDAWFALMHAHEQNGSAHKIDDVRRRMAEAFGESVSDRAKPVLSVAMIVKNEEAHLEACLASIHGLWDELIVVDTGSTDRTVQIAEQAGARVLSFPWIGDFSAARNKSLEACSGQWILWLDADDIFLPIDTQQIRQLVLTNIPRKAYGLMVKNSQDGGISGPIFNQIRIFPNRSDIRFQGKVHEQVIPSLQTLGIPIEFLPLRVIHTGYTDPETVKTKQRRNLELMRNDIDNSPQTVNAMKYFALGNAHFDLGDFAEAELWYRRSMEQAERVGEDKHILEILPVKLAECRANLGFQAEALAMMMVYVRRNPLQPNGIYLRAQLCAMIGKETEAVKDYGCLLYFQEQPTLMPVDYQQLRVKACKYLGEYWKNRGKQQLAVEIMRMALAIGKGETVAGIKLASLYFENALYQECLDNLKFAEKQDSSATILLSLGQTMIMLNDGRGALAVLEQGVRRYPQDPDLVGLLQDLRADQGST